MACSTTHLAKLFGPMNNNWLGRSNSALLALALIGMWKFAGYYMLFFLAGLQSIPGLHARSGDHGRRHPHAGVL